MTENNFSFQQYFPGLNGIRFIAAFTVIICHLEQRKASFGIPNWFHLYFFKNAAGFGVTLFFVLSGFLITYLLLHEKYLKGEINLKNFYLRRVLRIWPLYFLIIIISFFIAPHVELLTIPGISSRLNEAYEVKLLLYLLILPNVVYVLKLIVPFAGVTWSIGVEEQFYMIWPIVVKHTEKYVKNMVIIIVSVFLITHVCLYLANNWFPHHLMLSKILRFIGGYFEYFRVGSMAIGGIGAYLLFFKKDKILKILFQKNVQLLCLVLLIIMLLGYSPSLFIHEIYSILFIILILNISCNKQSLLTLENKLFNYFGKISYGLYMYHSLAIAFSLNFFTQISLPKTVNFHLLLFLSVFCLTAIVATISYYIFELPFLRLKNKI